MPEETIQLQASIPYLSYLDESGRLDEERAPLIEAEELDRLFYEMRLARRFEDKRLKLQRQGAIGTFAPVNGQEAANLGPISAITDDDWFVPAFRESAAALHRGTKMADLLVYDAGFNEGAAVPANSRNFPICIPVASQLPHAVGVAYGSQFRKEHDVTMTFLGDGATSEGDFHEALNFSATWRLPVVFVCQNNQWAISVPREEQTVSKTLAQKALAYGMPGIQVDGNDLFACRAAAEQAVARAREGGGPTLIECVTYRLSVHTTADDPSQYRGSDEVERWKKRDPIVRLELFLQQAGRLEEGELERLDARADEEIAQAWEEAQERMADMKKHPEEMFRHLLHDTPPYLELQRRAFMGDRGPGGAQSTSASADDGFGSSKDADSGSAPDDGSSSSQGDHTSSSTEQKEQQARDA